MVSTNEGCTDNSPMIPNQYDPTKNPFARKPLRKFSDALYVKHKTDVRMLGTAKANCKPTKTGNVLWSNRTHEVRYKHVCRQHRYLDVTHN